VLVRGSLRGDEDAAPKLAISSIQALEDVKIKLPEALRIKVPLHSPDAQLLTKLQAVFAAAPGTGKLMLRLEEPDQFAVDMEPHNVSVAADLAFIEQVESLVGRGAVQIIH
jgi:DNA polymerase-3 subunit alpha